MTNSELSKKLRKAIKGIKKLLDDSVPDLRQIDREPQFELGTMYPPPGLSPRRRFQYVKVDAGILGVDTKTGKKLRNIYYRWVGPMVLFGE